MNRPSRLCAKSMGRPLTQPAHYLVCLELRQLTNTRGCPTANGHRGCPSANGHRGCPSANGHRGQSCPTANGHRGCPSASDRRSCPTANAGLS